MTSPIHPDLEFALLLERCAIEAVQEGRYADARYFFDASDQWFPADDQQVSLRIRLLQAAMKRDSERRAA